MGVKRHRPVSLPADSPGPARPADAAEDAASPPLNPPIAAGGITSGAEETAEISAFDPASLGAGRATNRESVGPETSDDAEIRAAEYLDQLQRLKAEFDNYRKRTAKEREVWFVQAQAELAEGLLPVLDDVRRAREHEAAGEVAESEGWRLILKRFEDTLGRLGLETQGAEPGGKFDPEQHDAVMAEASADFPEGTILRVLEPGYLFHGRLLRRSRISFSTGPAGE
jgi:molecular chaperone GrpE